MLMENFYVQKSTNLNDNGVFTPPTNPTAEQIKIFEWSQSQ